MSTDSLKNKFLEQPINGMAVSDEFKAMAKANGFKTIGQLLDEVEMKNFPSLKNSGYRVLKELLDLLDRENLFHLVEE
jgi:hypothetical protein